MADEKKDNVVVDAAPNTVPKVPDDWKALGASSGYDPTPVDDLRLWIIGPSGEGKSTFMSSIPRHLILDFDKGANGIPGSKAIRVAVKDYDHYITMKDKLIGDAKAGKKYFHRVTIDTVDEWVDMIAGQLEKEKNIEDITEYGSQGSGYKLIKDRAFSHLRDLDHAGYIWSCIGHMTTKTEYSPIDKRERTVLREAIYPSLAKKITTKSDFKLTIYCIPQVVEKKKEQKLPDGRIIHVPAGSETVLKYYADSQTNEAKEGKSRAVPTMERKFEIPLVNGWDEFKKRYEAAVEEMKAKYGS